MKIDNFMINKLKLKTNTLYILSKKYNAIVFFMKKSIKNIKFFNKKQKNILKIK